MTQKSSNPGTAKRSTTTSQTGPGTSGTMTDQAQTMAEHVGEQAKQQAGRAIDTVREQASSRVAMQKDRAAEGLGTVAQALRQTGSQLQDQDQQGLSNYMDSAASQIERFSSYLQNKEVGQMIDDVENLARRQPALFLGGAFVVGLLGARFLKSSRPQPQYTGRYMGGSSMGMGGSYNTGYPRADSIRGSSGSGYEATHNPTHSSAYPPTSGATTSGSTMESSGPRAYDDRREE